MTELIVRELRLRQFPAVAAALPRPPRIDVPTRVGDMPALDDLLPDGGTLRPGHPAHAGDRDGVEWG